MAKVTRAPARYDTRTRSSAAKITLALSTGPVTTTPAVA